MPLAERDRGRASPNEHFGAEAPCQRRGCLNITASPLITLLPVHWYVIIGAVILGQTMRISRV